MTRPIVVRADTLDLQGQDSPSAKDHSQHNLPAGTGSNQLGPHQAAEIRHVQQERQSEELNLQDAWNQAVDDQNPQSPSQYRAGVEDSAHDDRFHSQHNGTHNHQDGEHTDDEDPDQSEEDDDDMMDRMSSSPSIDDGAYQKTLETLPWPPRSSSLTPSCGTFNRSATSSLDSYPFVNQPEHLPLTMSDFNHDIGPLTAESPISTMRLQDSSPSTHFLSRSPLSSDYNFHRHHLYGEYASHEDDFDGHGNDDDFRGDVKEFEIHNDEGYVENDEVQPAPNSGQSPETTTLAKPTEHLTAASIHYLTTLRPGYLPGPNLICEHVLSDRHAMAEDDSDLDSASNGSAESSSSWATVSDDNSTGELDSSRDDDFDDLSFYTDERFVDSGWGGECLRETEDIDFDFVYALHTFVATVEGQANATKGDTMVLLDDSNSYWWLVRIVKDSSIGYLPAEHIETPTERLARLNKHRNVDLSQAMLGDNMEKSKNPLKKAMRRRNAKTVQFAAPTYVEASDYEYDTEDEESALLADAYNNASAQGEEGPDTNHAEHRELGDGSDETRSRMSDSSGSDDAKDVKPPIEEPLGSPTLVDSTGIMADLAYDSDPSTNTDIEAAPLKSRKGTPRNADSFLKDDSAEPRRITLTPNILRDDGSSMSSLEKTRSTSFESVEKVAAPPEKVKDEKKKKEKKQGMLSGLFRSKKKDKKGKSDEDGAGETEKVSGEHSRQNSGQTSPVLDKSMSNPDKRGKLQKTQPAPSNGNMMAAAPAAVAVAPVSFEPATQQTQQHTQSSQARAEEPPTQFFAELEGSQVAYEAPTGQEEQIRDIQSRQSTRSPEAQPQLQQSSSMAALTAITNRMRPNSDEPQMKKQKVKKAKQRVELDDFDALSEEDEDEEEPERLSESPVDINHNTYMHGTEAVHIPMNIEDRDNSTPGQQTPDERASEDDERTSSPSMIDVPTEGNHLDEEAKQRSTTNLSEGTETTDDDPTPVPSGPQSPAGAMFQPWQSGLPHLKHAPTPPPARSAPFPPATKAPQQGEESMQRSVVTPSQAYPRRAPSLSSTASTRPSPSPSPVSATDSAASKGSWSDASLRAWLDGGEGNDIKDMLVVIHDKSNVQPVSRDHPLMQGLWTQERSTCSRMMGELDGLLSGFLGKKQYRSKGGLFSSASKGVTTTAAASGGDANKPISSIGSTTTTPPVVGA